MSYSRKDEGIMRRVVAFLRNKGIKVWVDNEKLVPGTPIWEAEIEKAIKAASAVVVFMSPDSKDSEWVRREITLADQYRKRIFPVLVSGDEDSSLTLRLVTRQFVDLRGNEKAGLIALHHAVYQYLNELIPQGQVASVESATSSHVTTQDTASIEARTSQSSRSTSPLVPWFALGWGICGMIAGFLWSEFNDVGGWLIAGILGGGGGGIVTALILRAEKVVSDQKSTFRIVLAWVLAGILGWWLGWELLDGTIGGSTGMAVFAIAGLVGTLGLDYFRTHWQSSVLIVLAWLISGAILWFISRTILIETLDMNDQGTAWAIGTALGWAIGGFGMGRQLLKKNVEGVETGSDTE
jgi:hypothetical protein